VGVSAYGIHWIHADHVHPLIRHHPEGVHLRHKEVAPVVAGVVPIDIAEVA
jgi:hypothetical protein